MADPRGLGNALNRVSHLSLGLSAGRWANARSWLRAALKLSVPVMPGTSNHPLLSEWEPLASEARKNGPCWLRLCRLLRWLSARQFARAPSRSPTWSAIARNTFPTLFLGIRNSPGRRRAGLGSVCATLAQPGLGSNLLNLEDPRLFGLPWRAFPASLRAEVDQLLERYAGRNFDEDGPLHPLRPATLELPGSGVAKPRVSPGP